MVAFSQPGLSIERQILTAVTWLNARVRNYSIEAWMGPFLMPDGTESTSSTTFTGPSSRS